MPIYEYRGLNKSGNTAKGTIDADSLKTARTKLKKDGIYVTEIRDKKKQEAKKNSGPKSTKSISVQELSLMTRQLAVLIKSNIPLVDALTAVSEQVENPTLSEALADCKNMVNEGAPFHKSLAKYPNVFSNIFITMVEAGEMSGTLDVILLRLAEFTEAQAELRAKVSSALTYPILMLVVTTGLVLFIFTVLMPKMMTVFEGQKITLPWFTVVLFNTSQFLINYWIYLGAAVAMGIMTLVRWIRSPEGSKQWDSISLTIPYVGPLVRMVAVSRFTRTLATLLNGGVPMLNALDIVKKVVDNHVIALAIEDARNNISEGESISGPLKKSGQFPPIVIHMVSIGEKTGELENMLSQVADAYDFQVKTKLASVTSLIGPIVVIVMGAAIGSIVFAVMIPMFEMTNQAM